MQGDLTSLIERVEKATGPDRELDAAIEVAMLGTTHMPDDLIYYKTTTRADHCLPGAYWHVSRSGEYLRTSEKYTSSLDAALALVEEKLPGWDWSLRHSVSADGDVRYGNAVLWVPSDPRDDEAPRHWANHSSPVIALLLAMLLALQAARSSSPTEGDADA